MTAKNETELKRLLRRIEQLMNKPIPGTPVIGGRVRYVPLPSGKRAQAQLTARAAQVLAFLQRKQAATADAVCKALEVNRNVVAGAMHELRQAKLVKSERIGFSGTKQVASAAEYSGRRRRTKKGSKK